jgi:signal transduction histidine kinase
LPAAFTPFAAAEVSVPSRTAPKSHEANPPEPPELSRHLLNAQEEERRRISRELHDETGQALMVLRFQLEMLAGEAHSREERTQLQESLDLLDRPIEGLRRTIARLSPRVLEELGLVGAIRREVRLLTAHTAIEPRLDLPSEMAPLDHDLEVALYRSVQEALHNVAKHSQAKHVSMRLAVAAGRLSLVIEDDGIGFSVRAAKHRGFGLTGMRERVAALGGSVKVRSQKEKGTQIRIVFSLPEHRRHARAADDDESVRRIPAA